MFKHLIVSALTLATVLGVTATTSQAKESHQVKSLVITNATKSNNQLNRSNNKRIIDDTSNRQIASNGDRSMEYVRRGWAEQQSGNKQQALLSYYQALQLDQYNGTAFLAAGTLLGNTEEGITCIKAAALLFQVQGNQVGYDAATAWLENWGIAN